MQCDRFPAENYLMFALGALEEQPSEAISAHLRSGCQACQAELRRSLGVWSQVGLSAPAREPSRALRDRVLQSVRVPDARVPERPRAGLLWGWAQLLTACGAAVLALAAGWYLGTRTTAAPPATVREVRVPVPDEAPLKRLEQENRDLTARLNARPPVPAVPSRGTQPASPPVLPPDNPLAAVLAEERATVAQLRAELSRQQDLAAAATTAAQDANRKYLAVLQQKSTADEGQKQLASLRAENQQKERQLAEYKLLLAAEKRTLARNIDNVALLSDPGLRMIHLRGTEKGRGIHGHAFLAAGSKLLFFGSELPAPSPGRTYQLWLIRANSPAIVSAGTFSPDSANKAILQFEDGSATTGVTALAVTEEPSGGSQKPTGHKLLIGS